MAAKKASMSAVLRFLASFVWKLDAFIGARPASRCAYTYSYVYNEMQAMMPASICAYSSLMPPISNRCFAKWGTICPIDAEPRPCHNQRLTKGGWEVDWLITKKELGYVKSILSSRWAPKDPAAQDACLGLCGLVMMGRMRQPT